MFMNLAPCIDTKTETCIMHETANKICSILTGQFVQSYPVAKITPNDGILMILNLSHHTLGNDVDYFTWCYLSSGSGSSLSPTSTKTNSKKVLLV